MDKGGHQWNEIGDLHSTRIHPGPPALLYSPRSDQLRSSPRRRLESAAVRIRAPLPAARLPSESPGSAKAPSTSALRISWARPSVRALASMPSRSSRCSSRIASRRSRLALLAARRAASPSGSGALRSACLASRITQAMKPGSRNVKRVPCDGSHRLMRMSSVRPTLRDSGGRGSPVPRYA